MINQISQQSSVSAETTKQIISSISESELSNTERVREVAKETGVTEEKVKEVVKTSERIAEVKDILTQKDMINQISQQSSVSAETTKQIISSISESELSNTERVREVAKETGVTEEKVKEVVSKIANVKQTQEFTKKKDLAEKVAVTQNIKTETIQQILSKLSYKELTDLEKIKEIAKENDVTEEKVKEVVKTAEKMKVKRRPVSELVPAAQYPVPVQSSTVSVEDYEEVKQMWLKHYRSAPVPVTESIKTRSDWLVTEEKQLTNITNLLASTNPVLKQQGLDKVSDILPFMLLGGFSESEIQAYIKAKLEADRQVLEETAIEEKAKEKAKEELKAEEEEVMVSKE